MRMAFGLPVLIAPLVDEPRTGAAKGTSKSRRPPTESENACVDSGSFPFVGVPPTESQPSLDAAFSP